MTRLFLAPAEHGIVVFHIWPGLPYAPRMTTAAILVLSGLIWQGLAAALFPGILLVLAGNLLLLVCGYNNKVDFGAFAPSSDWRVTTAEKLREIQSLDLKMKSWDESALDVTNALGAMLFILLLGGTIGLLYVAAKAEELSLALLAGNTAVLLFPHWLTGIRSILTRPKLMLKVDAYLSLYDYVKQDLSQGTLEFSILVQGKGEQKLPSDVRFRYVPKDADAGFLGLQGQMAVNEVQGKSFLYFYVVAVANQGYGLSKRLAGWTAPAGLVLEPSDSGPVEVLVLRQKTTKNSGYSTDELQIRSIFHYGLILTQRVALPPSQNT
jgi:hypothetical protein